MPDCSPRYEPRRPQDTTLYQVFQEHLETFLSQARDEDGRSLPGFVEGELRRFLECGILAYGFARVHCTACHDDLFLPFSCKKRGFCPSCCGRRMAATAAHLLDHVIPFVPVRHFVFTLPTPIRFLFVHRPELADVCLARYLRTVFEWTAERTGVTSHPSSGCGAVTFIQRFSGNLGFFLHWHSLVLSGAYQPDGPDGALRFVPLPEPTTRDVKGLEDRLARDILACLEERGVLEEGEISIPSEDLQPATGLELCQSASMQNRVAFGPRSGLAIRREGADSLGRYFDSVRAGSSHGFSLFIGHAVTPDRRDELERLARYISRPPVSDERLSLMLDGKVRFQLKRPASDGATALLFDGPELIERLAALVPPPRRNLLRYHGLWGAPHKPCYVESGIMRHSGSSRVVGPCGVEVFSGPPGVALHIIRR